MNRIELGAIGSSASLGVSWEDLHLPEGWLALIDKIAPASRPTDIQRKVLGDMNALEGRRNLIVSAPTNSGKSLLGFLLLSEAVREGKRALLLEPFRAIAQEKFDELDRLTPTLAAFTGKNVRVKISTGDYRLEDEMMQDPPSDSSEILVATPERIEAIMRRSEHVKWWNSFGTVCVDEAHLISHTRRGPTLEFLITSLLLTDNSPRMILLSATLGDVTRALKWLEPCDFVHSSVRQPLLDRTIITLDDDEATNDVLLKLTRELVTTNETNLLIFTYRTDGATKLVQLLNEQLPGQFGPAGALAYHSRMPKVVRDQVRAKYLSCETRCVVTTTALAAGVNLPTTQVIVRDLTFYGIGPVSIDQLVQMAGRAGRGENRGHAYFIHHKNDAWQIGPLSEQLKEPPFQKLSSALVSGAGSVSRKSDWQVPKAASVILSLLVRRDAPMSEGEILDFFDRSLVGDPFKAVLHESLQWMCDIRRVLAYRTDEGGIAATSLGKAAIRGTLPLVLAAGIGNLVRDVLSLGEEQTFFGEWTELDHLLILELLAERTVNLRPFSEELTRQVDQWMERSPKKSILYRRLLRGAANFSKAEELFGSLLIQNVPNHRESNQWARRKGYSAMFRAIVLWERASGGDPAVIERYWRFPNLLGTEEPWRDDRLWLLGALAEIFDLRCFYFHLQEECQASLERARQVKYQLRRLRLFSFDALGRVKHCSPLGPLLVQMRSSTGRSAGIGVKTIQKIESLGIDSLAKLAKFSPADLKTVGISSIIIRRIEAYIRKRLI